MTLREDLNALTPRMRRYARALATGSPAGVDSADDLVHATLMRVLGTRTLGTQHDLAIRCFATLIQLNREAATHLQAPSPANMAKPSLVTTQSAAAQPLVRQNKLALGLMGLAVEDREALLLVALENFDHGDAARILRISRAAFFSKLTRSREALDSHLRHNPAPTASGTSRRLSHLHVVK